MKMMTCAMFLFASRSSLSNLSCVFVMAPGGLDFGLAFGGGHALGHVGRFILAIERDKTGVAIAERAIRPGHVLSVEVLHGLGWRFLAVIHFMIPWRVEDRNAGAGGDAQKFLVLVVHALGVLRVFSGDGVPGPEHKGCGRIHSLHSAEDVSRNGGLRIAGVRRTVVARKHKSELRWIRRLGQSGRLGQL